jgi:hypothetical protein
VIPTIQEMEQYRGRSNDLSRRLIRTGIGFDGFSREKIDFKEGVSDEKKIEGNAILAGWDWNAPYCPESVAMFQLRKAMRETPINEDPKFGDTLSAIEAYLAGSDDTDLADDMTAAVVRRDHNTVIGLAEMFDWDDDDLDALFRLAATK